MNCEWIELKQVSIKMWILTVKVPKHLRRSAIQLNLFKLVSKLLLYLTKTFIVLDPHI